MARLTAQLSAQIHRDVKEDIADLLAEDRRYGRVMEADVIRATLEEGLPLLRSKYTNQERLGVYAKILRTRATARLTAQLSAQIHPSVKKDIADLLAEDRHYGRVMEADVIRATLEEGLPLLRSKYTSQERLGVYAKILRGT